MQISFPGQPLLSDDAAPQRFREKKKKKSSKVISNFRPHKSRGRLPRPEWPALANFSSPVSALQRETVRLRRAPSPRGQRTSEEPQDTCGEKPAADSFWLSLHNFLFVIKAWRCSRASLETGCVDWGKRNLKMTVSGISVRLENTTRMGWKRSCAFFPFFFE